MKTLIKHLMYISILISPLAVFANSAVDVGVITAVPDEAHMVIAALKNPHTVKKGIYHYKIGNINHHRVAVLIGGVSAINAAVATTEMLHQFNPNHLLFTGSSGALNNKFHVGDVLIIKTAYQLDIGNISSRIPAFPKLVPNPVKNVMDPASFNSSTSLLSAAEKIKYSQLYAYNEQGKKIKAQVLPGTVATSLFFPDSKADLQRAKNLHADAIAMETTSFLKVCWLFNKPCLAFRGISDIDTNNVKQNKFTQYNDHNEKLAANNSATAVVDFINFLQPDNK